MPAPASAQRIRETIEPVVTAAGLWLEDVELGRDGGRAVVRVVLDSPEDVEEQVDLDGVADVSRAVSAALDDLDGLPPIDLHIGDRDILRPAVDTLAARLRGATTELRVHEVPAMFHVWMTRAIPEAARTRRRLSGVVRALTHP